MNTRYQCGGTIACLKEVKGVFRREGPEEQLAVLWVPDGRCKDIWNTASREQRPAIGHMGFTRISLKKNPHQEKSEISSLKVTVPYTVSNFRIAMLYNYLDRAIKYWSKCTGK